MKFGTIVVVSGSTDATEHEHGQLIRQSLSFLHSGGTITLVHGNRRGTDKICSRLAKEWGWLTHVVHADWESHHEHAPIIRDRLMIESSRPHYVFIFQTQESTKNDAKSRFISYTAKSWSKLRMPVMEIIID